MSDWKLDDSGSKRLDFIFAYIDSEFKTIESKLDPVTLKIIGSDDNASENLKLLVVDKIMGTLSWNTKPTDKMIDDYLINSAIDADELLNKILGSIIPPGVLSGKFFPAHDNTVFIRDIKGVVSDINALFPDKKMTFRAYQILADVVNYIQVLVQEIADSKIKDYIAEDRFPQIHNPRKKLYINNLYQIASKLYSDPKDLYTYEDLVDAVTNLPNILTLLKLNTLTQEK